MQLIKEIKISYFRSFSKTIHIKEIKDLNILSGKNDSGKSNILKALNLFFTENKIDFYNYFNFDRDFSKHRANESRTLHNKQLIQIAILFDRTGFYDSKVLPKEFWIEKTWNKEGKFHDRKTKTKAGALAKYIKDEKEYDAEVKSSTTSFLKKIHFLYIPAIKDYRFFDYLKKEYQESLGIQNSKLKDSLSSTQEKTLKAWMEQLTAGDITDLLSQKIDLEAQRMMSYFLGNTLEINTSNFAIPELDFSKVLEVITENNIPLTSRGDGIQAKFIPQILNEITRNKKADLVIWGFEEPENSYEYANAQILADKFMNEYANDKQIFLTSHAFNFISLEGENVSLYRIWRQNLENGTDVKFIKNDKALIGNHDSDTLHEELGTILLNKELEELFKSKLHELNTIAELQRNLKDKIVALNKPVLYVEDKYEQIYKISWLKLNDIDCDRENFERIFDEHAPFIVWKAEGASNLEGFLRASNIDHLKEKTIIGLFDFDEAGKKSFNSVKSSWNQKSNIQGSLKEGLFLQRKPSLKFYCLLIPIPDRLNTLANLSFPSLIEVENLLPETFLKTNSFAIEKTTTGNVKYLEIHSDKKHRLWEDLFSLTKSDFIDFEPLYVKIKSLCE